MIFLNGEGDKWNKLYTYEKKKIQNEVLKVILKHRLKIQKYTLRYVTSKSNIILNNIITSVYF